MKIFGVVITLVSSLLFASSCNKEREDEHRIAGSVVQNAINISITDVAGASLVANASLTDNLSFYSEDKKNGLPFMAKELNGVQVISVATVLPYVKDMRVINKVTNQNEILEISEGATSVYMKINGKEEKIECKIRLEVFSDTNASPNTLLGNGKIYIHEIIFKGKTIVKQGLEEIVLPLVYSNGELIFDEQ